MANFELNNDFVYTIPIHVTNAGGQLEPAPAGDTFTVTGNSNPGALTATIFSQENGSAALVLTPLVALASDITVQVGDSAGLTSAAQTFDIVADQTPKNIVLALADATTQAQAVPPDAPAAPAAA